MARHSRLLRFPQWGPLHLGIRTDMSTYVIQKMLGALEEYYSHADHEEIAVNQPGEVWCRRHRADEHGRIWVRFEDDRQIGRESCRDRCVSTCRSRWSPYH